MKEILRLHYEGKLSNRKISKALNVSHSVVNDYIREFKNSNKEYEDIASLHDSEIKALCKATVEKTTLYPMPDFGMVHVQLRNKIVTLQLLHEEYIENCPNKNGYGYTWFCARYKEYAKKVNPSMRLVRKAGEKIFVDFSGKTVDIINPTNGVITEAQIFVAVLSASGYPFVKAITSQKKRDEDRTNQSSLIITSQLPIEEWHEYLHNATIADAILDRIVHNSYKIEIEGPSQRKENAKKTMK